ncbi:MAG: phosphatase PAP2 family protein [Clostridia bacterium]|nr:phosphatase PAP2 family protein [Clostridia bacterium]
MGARTARNQKKAAWALPAILCAVFVLFTVLAVTVDKGAFTPQAVDKASGNALSTPIAESQTVGFSGVNLSVSQKNGYRPTLYKASNYLGYLCMLTAAAFCALAVWQLVKRKSIKRVDMDLLLLIGVYALFAVLYVLFEKLSLNVRPFALDGEIEASYPSTHTLLGVMIMGASAMYLRAAQEKRSFYGPLSIALIVIGALTVLLRLLSGVHWLTDILGGVLLSAAVLSVYHTLKA